MKSSEIIAQGEKKINEFISVINDYLNLDLRLNATVPEIVSAINSLDELNPYKRKIKSIILNKGFNGDRFVLDGIDQVLKAIDRQRQRQRQQSQSRDPDWTQTKKQFIHCLKCLKPLHGVILEQDSLSQIYQKISENDHLQSRLKSFLRQSFIKRDDGHLDLNLEKVKKFNQKIIPYYKSLRKLFNIPDNIPDYELKPYILAIDRPLSKLQLRVKNDLQVPVLNKTTLIKMINKHIDRVETPEVNRSIQLLLQRQKKQSSIQNKEDLFFSLLAKYIHENVSYNPLDEIQKKFSYYRKINDPRTLYFYLSIFESKIKDEFYEKLFKTDVHSLFEINGDTVLFNPNPAKYDVLLKEVAKALYFKRLES